MTLLSGHVLWHAAAECLFKEAVWLFNSLPRSHWVAEGRPVPPANHSLQMWHLSTNQAATGVSDSEPCQTACCTFHCGVSLQSGAFSRLQYSVSVLPASTRCSLTQTRSVWSTWTWSNVSLFQCLSNMFNITQPHKAKSRVSKGENRRNLDHDVNLQSFVQIKSNEI